MASRRHRRDMAEAEDYDDDDHDDGSRSSNGSETAADDNAFEEEEEEEHLGLHSMTAKGIQHLCSELLEIKKASEQDFRTNVYLSYLSFLRTFQEAGDLEKDLHGHVLAHRSLVDHLGNNLEVLRRAESSISSSWSGGSLEDAAASGGDPKDDELELLELELDVLLSEHRMDEALQLLELQAQRKQTAAGAAEAEAMAMASRKARVADRLASVAGDPRTARPELLKALSGLCRLGEAPRANHLLFKLHRPVPAADNSSIKDLARTVFSSILEACRSFVALHGRPSPHAPQLARWAREEVEDFGAAFAEYVKSASPAGGGQIGVMVPALEAAKCALSYCSLLGPLGVVSEQEVLDLVAPRLQEVLAMYAGHLKDVTRLLVVSDAWALGRFPVAGILSRARSPDAAAAALQIDYCLLTTSGRKFVTLVQEVVEDVYPLPDLRVRTSVLQLVADLFGEYMRAIVELVIVPRKEEAATAKDQQQYAWQLAILINCTTLVSLFPIIARGAFESGPPSAELDSMILLIKEAAGQVWACFCQQFIRDTMSSSSGLQQSAASLSPQGMMMPSIAFQALFQRVRQLNNLYGTILAGKDGAMKKLLQELMEEMVLWLSNNLDSWIHHAQGVPRDTLLQQIQLDVRFFLEFAQSGGFSSDNIRNGALDLLTKAEEKLAPDRNRNSGGTRDESWAIDAAKHALGVLMAIRSIPHQDKASVKNVVVAKGGEGMNHDAVATSEQDHKDEDHERGACDGGKSSDEFVSIEEDDEDGMSSEELKLGPGSSHQEAPDDVSEIDLAAEVWEDNQRRPDDTAEAGDHESGLPAGMCRELDAIEVEEEVIGGRDDSSCELALQDGGGGISTQSMQASTTRLPPPAGAAEKSARISRKKREPGSRSSRPRWQ